MEGDLNSSGFQLLTVKKTKTECKTASRRVAHVCFGREAHLCLGSAPKTCLSCKLTTPYDPLQCTWWPLLSFVFVQQVNQAGLQAPEIEFPSDQMLYNSRSVPMIKQGCWNRTNFLAGRCTIFSKSLLVHNYSHAATAGYP